MDRIAFLKFFELIKNNIGKFLIINLLFFIPLVMLVAGASRIIPLGINFFDSLDVSIIDVNRNYGKLVMVVYYFPEKESGREDNFFSKIFGKTNKASESSPVHKSAGEKNNVYGVAYLLDVRVFNKVRKHVFMSFSGDPLSNAHFKLLQKVAISVKSIDSFDKPLEFYDKAGHLVMKVMLEPAAGGVAQIFFYKSRRFLNIPLYLSIVLFAGGFLILAVSIGGITEYTQRIVFHENRKFSYLFEAIRRHILHSLIISLILLLVLAAIIANIYFYMFVMGNETSVFVAAINVWLFFFMILMFMWVFPISVINPEDSIMNIFKKAVYLCFDNFTTSLDMFLILILEIIISTLTLGLIPGISGIMAFLNSGIKEVSSRYIVEQE